MDLHAKISTGGQIVPYLDIFVGSEQTAALPGVNSRLGRSKGLDCEVGHLRVQSVALEVAKSATLGC